LAPSAAAPRAPAPFPAAVLVCPCPLVAFCSRWRTTAGGALAAVELGGVATTISSTVLVRGGGVALVPVVPVVVLLAGGLSVVLPVLVCVLWPPAAASPCAAPDSDPASVTVIGIALSRLAVEPVCAPAAWTESTPPTPVALRPPPASSESSARRTRPREPEIVSAMRRT